MILATVALVAACGKVPQAEVDAAAMTLNAAESAEAATYASDELAQAKLANEALDAELAVQAEKFGLMRSYDHTKELAAAAEQAALAARTAAEAGKAKAQADATAALESLTGAEQSAAALLAELGACRRKPKGFAADLEGLSGTLAGFTQERSAVESALAGGDFLGASTQAASLQGQVDSLILEMGAAKAKIGC